MLTNSSIDGTRLRGVRLRRQPTGDINLYRAELVLGIQRLIRPRIKEHQSGGERQILLDKKVTLTAVSARRKNKGTRARIYKLERTELEEGRRSGDLQSIKKTKIWQADYVWGASQM